MSYPIEHFRRMLPVNKHRLDDDLELIPQVIDMLYREVAKLEARAAEDKDQLARVESRLTDEAKDEDPKASAAIVEGRVKREPSRIEAWNRYQTSKTLAAEWAGILEAFRQKSYALKTLADLYGSQYFTTTTDSAGSRRSVARSTPDRPDDEARAAMRRNFSRASPPLESPTESTRRERRPIR